ncbi:MFS transporter [Zhengella mangrovi]|uniref:MFS transporter n=1 Tax=Zhengella mangrovi TaxID=1982044 RepID=A0A2G1QMJ1_9HYPH|nr:MFS transporter [Zhengella mangrovi]PHP66745.1 MFS transporter [Zhengella mangrovi]
MNRILPMILAVALFMENMDSTVIATALPVIAADLGTSPVALKLALTAYLVSLAIFIPVSAFMADRFGAKRVFRVAIAVFMAGSLACAVAGSLGAFVGSRFLQGMGGAMMTPLARLILVRATPKNDLVNAMAWLTIPALFGPFAGPPLGGFITTWFSWHWIFLINLPIGLAGILLATRFLPDTETKDAGTIDWKGFILAGLAASGVVFGLSVISLPALPPVVGVAALVTGIVSGVLYVRHARRATAPLLDLKLFREPAFRATITGLLLFRIGSGATPFLLPLLFQLSFGMSAFQSGMVTFAGAGGALVMKFVAAPILRALGFRTTILLAILSAAGIIAASALFTGTTPWLVLVGVLLSGGLARSLFFTSASALTFSGLRPEQAAQATAISSVNQQVAVALGVALAGLILEATGTFTGNGFDATAFSTAFVLVGLVSASAVIPFLALPGEAGAEMSGHRKGQAALQAAALSPSASSARPLKSRASR